MHGQTLPPVDLGINGQPLRGYGCLDETAALETASANPQSLTTAGPLAAKIRHPALQCSALQMGPGLFPNATAECWSFGWVFHRVLRMNIPWGQFKPSATLVDMEL